jgi:thiamine biosynthesis lipoprotein
VIVSVATSSWSGFGTTVVVGVTRVEELDAATCRVRDVLHEIDGAANRFRVDSEVSRVNRAGGAAVRVSAMFVRVATCALRAARITGGDLDPTIGASLRVAGYDRDFAAISSGCEPVQFVRAAGWRCVRLDADSKMIRLPMGVELDFGATAKALAADIAAARAVAGARGGVIVSIGGDLATAGTPPRGGWPVRVTDDHRAVEDGTGQTVAVSSGGLATSSTRSRRWSRGSAELHHILDPATGAPVSEHWRTVSVVAGSCVDANIASTTAILRGAAAPRWLAGAGLPARLVRTDGSVAVTAGWPANEQAAR